MSQARASARSGKCAEHLAAAYLSRHGLELLARNVRCKAGEIDLVCRDGSVLVVVEVRQRTRLRFRRSARLGRGAQAAQAHARHALLAAHPSRLAPLARALRRRRRAGRAGGRHEIAWIKDAFRAARLDHLELGLLGGGRCGPGLAGRARRRVRRIGIRVAFRENHALAGLARVDAKYRAHRHLHRDTPPKRASKLTASLPSFSLRRGETHVQHDLAVLDVLTRHAHARRRRVDHDVRRLAAVGDPLVQRPQQIRSAGLQCRISRSATLKHARNVERAKIEFMYFTMGCAWCGSSMP